MKKIIILTAVAVLLAGTVFAAEMAAEKAAAPAEAAKVMAYEGIVIDNACATANKEKLPEFIKTHPKSCALMPNCAASGYSLYLPDGKLMAFDKASNDKILVFLKKKASKLNVKIMASEVNGELSLVSIKNEPAKKKAAAAPAPAAPAAK